MTEEEQKNIWDRYFKADPSRKNTKLGGIGAWFIDREGTGAIA